MCSALVLGAACGKETAPEPNAKATPPASTSKPSSAKPGLKLPEGEPMVSFELAANDGSRFDLRPLLGKKVVVLYFFATWYGGAADEIKALQTLASDKASAPLSIVAIAIDKPEARAKVDAFVQENQVKLPVLLDPEGNLVQGRYTGGVPDATTTLVIDAKGNLIATRGPEDEEETPLREVVEALLARAAP